MDQNTILLVSILAGLAVGAVVVAVGVWGLPKLKREEQGYPLEAEIEAALLPLAFEGICSAFRLSERAMDELMVRIRGADKKALADTIYELLPDKVGDFPLEVVKAVVTRERFEAVVQAAFDRFDRDFIAFQGRWESLFEEWREAWQSQDADEAEMAEALTPNDLQSITEPECGN